MIQFRANADNIYTLQRTYYSLDANWPIILTQLTDFTWEIYSDAQQTDHACYREKDFVSMMNRVQLITQSFPVWVRM